MPWLNVAVWRKEFRENHWKLVTYAILLLADAVVTVFTYEVLKKLAGGLSAPGWAQQQFGFIFGSFDNYVWSNWFGKNLYQMSTLFLVLLGMGTIAAETSRGTAGFLLTKPIRRRAVLFSKWLASAVGFAVIAIVTTLLLYPLAVLSRHTLGMGRLLASLPLTLSTGLVILSLAALASVIFDDQVKAGGAAAVVLILLSIPSWFQRIKKWSLFYYLSAQPVLENNSPHWLLVLLMLAIAAALYTLAVGALERKDF